MNIYDKQQITLSENLKEFSELAYYEKIKNEIKTIQKQINISTNTDTNKLIKELSILIRPAQLLLNQQRNIQNDFIYTNTTNKHEIFKPLLVNLDLIDSKIKTLKQSKLEVKIINQLEQLCTFYKESHLIFIEKFVGQINSIKPNTVSVDIFKTLPLTISEDLEIGYIKSLELSYQMVSYDNIEHEYSRKEGNGLSIGSFIDNVYLKVDNGSRLLKPFKEYAVYQLYKSLLSESDSAILSPTQLLLISKIQILPPDFTQSEVRRELNQFKTQYNTQSTEQVLQYEPDFRIRLENALNQVREIYVQASLKSNGKTLEHYLESGGGSNMDYSDLDFESFSSHIISSLLVIPTDYKADNLIVENGTGRIIGIDNDEALDSVELKKTSSGYTYVKIKNVLYTLQPLMNKPIHEGVRNQIIKHNPNLFILKWLLVLEKKQSNYESLISLPLHYFHDIDINGNQFNKIKGNIRDSLNLPLQFNRGWIKSMCTRFKLIINLLNSDSQITHQHLFLQVHPYASLYYESLSKVHKHPLDQIASIYKFEFTFKQLFEKYHPNSINGKDVQRILNQLENEISPMENPISIKDSIGELISNTNYTDLCDNPIFLMEFIDLTLFVINSGVCSGSINFNETWYGSKQLILTTLIQNGAPIIQLDNFIKHFNITKSEIESYSISILHTSILANCVNVIDQIQYLVYSLGLNIEKIENRTTALDLSVCLKSTNISLVSKLLNLGAGKLSNASIFCKFYQRLSNNEKLQFKTSLDKLFQTNPKINWKISLNALLPIINYPVDNNKKDFKYLLEVTGNCKRFISEQYWNQLFNSDGTVKKLNDYGTRSVTLIQDEFGNGIYFKFEPQFPGTEIAVTRLSELLFGSDSHLSPYCELVSINNQPVLLIQQIPGKPLIDVLNENPSLVDNIESSNISKQLVMSMLSNNGDGNLGNFIINQNRLYSIDNDQSFMPPISKQIGSALLFGKQSLQVETVLLLFNQMNDPIHQDVIDRFVNLDMFQIVKGWLINLQYHHQSSLDYFKSNRFELKKNQETIIGISFTRGSIEQLYSKLRRLQQEIFKCNASKKKITHNQLLEIIEPLISNRYKQINNNLSIIEKYTKLKNLTQKSSAKLFTCSTHPTSQLIESRGIPNARDIQDQLWNGKFGPTEALDELNTFESNYLILDQLFDSNGKKPIPPISDYQLEFILKNSDFSTITGNQFKSIINLIKSRELNSIYFKNCFQMDSKIIKQFKLDTIVRMDLSGSSFTQFDLGSSNILNSLISLKLNNCLNLISIKLNIPNLKVFKLSNCKRVSNFNVTSPNLLHLNLKATTLDIGKFDKLFKKLEYLNLSECLFPTLTLSFDDLICLDLNSMKNLMGLNLQLPSIEIINLENCNEMLSVKPIDYNVPINGNLKSALDKHCIAHPQDTIERRFINQLRRKLDIGVDFPDVIGNIHFYQDTSTAESDYIRSSKWYGDLGELHVHNYKGISESAFERLLHPEYCKVYYRDWYNRPFNNYHFGEIFKEVNLFNVKYPLEIGTISPDHIYQKIHFRDDYNHVLLPGVIPSSIYELHFYNIGKQLVIGSIPSGIKTVHLHDYGFQLTSGIIPTQLGELHLYNIKQPLTERSLPVGVEALVLHSGFNHQLTSNILRNIKVLYLGDIKCRLTIGSLPNGLEKLSLDYGFSCKLEPGIIPNTVVEIFIGDIEHSLVLGSIPNSVKKLQFGNYTHQLDTGIISNSIHELYIGNISQNILIGSIPNGLKKLVFCDGFNHQLSADTIPNSEELIILDIKKPLTIESLPEGLKCLIFDVNSYKHKITSDIIPNSTTELHFYNCQDSLLDLQNTKIIYYNSSLTTNQLKKDYNQIYKKF